MIDDEIRELYEDHDIMKICLDFDGVIHQYISKWTGPHEINDAPVANALEMIQTYIEDGMHVIVMSVRCTYEGGPDAIKQWMYSHGWPSKVVESITFSAVKPPAHIYIDDRGWTFDGTWPSPQEIRQFSPWNR